MKDLVELEDSLEAAQGQRARLRGHDVLQATGSPNEDITSETEIGKLVSTRTTTVEKARTQHATVAQATTFIEDLDSELASWADNEHQWLSLHRVGDRVVPSRVRSGSCELLDLTHQLRQDRDEVGASLAGA